MTIIPVFNRELPVRLESILSYQRREPIHLRLVSQHILDFDLDGISIFTILKRLKTRKNANITIILDKKTYRNTSQKVIFKLNELEDLGINIHIIRNLHAKIITVENNHEQCLLVTSANLSHNAYFVAREAGIYFQNDQDGIFNSFKKYITDLIKTSIT